MLLIAKNMASSKENNMASEEIKLHYCTENSCLVDEGYCRDYCKYRKTRAIQDFEPEKCSFYYPEEQYPRSRNIWSKLDEVINNVCGTCCCDSQ